MSECPKKWLAEIGHDLIREKISIVSPSTGITEESMERLAGILAKNAK